jgi:hypothetical protein
MRGFRNVGAMLALVSMLATAIPASEVKRMVCSA